MRKISPIQIFVFSTTILLIIALSLVLNYRVVDRLPLGDFRGITLVFSFFIFFYVFSVIVYRLLFWLFPLPNGDIERGSRDEFVYHVYILFFLLIFHPVMRSGLVPIPMSRLMYIALGARIGVNTYCAGLILDPCFVSLGADSVVGQSAAIVPHVIEGDRLGHYPVVIGSRVTIGAYSVVLSDVTIADGAQIAAGAVVPKGSRIGAGEVWGGVPAKRIR